MIQEREHETLEDLTATPDRFVDHPLRSAWLELSTTLQAADAKIAFDGERVADAVWRRLQRRRRTRRILKWSTLAGGSLVTLALLVAISIRPAEKPALADAIAKPEQDSTNVIESGATDRNDRSLAAWDDELEAPFQATNDVVLSASVRWSGVGASLDHFADAVARFSQRLADTSL